MPVPIFGTSRLTKVPKCGTISASDGDDPQTTSPGKCRTEAENSIPRGTVRGCVAPLMSSERAKPMTTLYALTVYTKMFPHGREVSRFEAMDSSQADFIAQLRLYDTTTPSNLLKYEVYRAA